MTAYPGANAPLSDHERETLKIVAGRMIPASVDYGVPGADDSAIFADIVRSVERDRNRLGDAVRAIDELSGGRLVALSAQERECVLARFRSSHPALAAVVESVIVRCYYRDDRVMKSIGMEARPPFPGGYRVEQGDLALLEPVTRRGKLYRDADDDAAGVPAADGIDRSPLNGLARTEIRR